MEIIKLIEDKLKEKSKLVIGISGISLSGKTTYANELKNMLKEKNKNVDLISLENNIKVYEESLKDKNPSKYYYENAYDFNAIQNDINIALQNNDIVIVEGLLLFKNTSNLKLDIKVWLDTTFTTSINRAKNEKEKYADYFMWLQKQHFSIDDPKSKADIIIITDEELNKPLTTYVDLKNEPTSVEKMKWLYEPTNWKLKGEGLYLETDEITDFWQRTHYGFRNDNAHFKYIETDKDFTMTTKVKFNPVHQFDQCGLCVRIDEDNWIKSSIEYELNNPPKLGAVVTNHGYSDWSTQELDKQVYEAEFRITREGQDYKIEVNIENKGYIQLRICHLHNDNKNVMAGIYACSPIDKGYSVVFEDINIKEEHF